jgi:hypothetical protein
MATRAVLSETKGGGVISKEDSGELPTTEQDIVLESSLVMITPGLLCQISLRVPMGTTRFEGLESSDFHILKPAETGGIVEAIILTTIRFGQLLEFFSKSQGYLSCPSRCSLDDGNNEGNSPHMQVIYLSPT